MMNDRWMDRRADRWLQGLMDDRWMDDHKDGCTEEWTDGIEDWVNG